MEIRTVNVDTPSKKYNVYIGFDILDNAGKYALEVRNPGKSVIVTDSTVDKLYSERLTASLKSAGYDTVKYVFPAGEKSKTAATLISLLNFMAENKLTRSDTVFALGGGVVGDLAGLAAAVYMRGIGLVQLPTTLLASVDSSVGGKTAVDLEAGKNLAGAFYQPDLVICDTNTLSTLSDSEFANGCAEVIKYAFIRDASLLDLLVSPENMDVCEVITRCVGIKRDVVCRDERESGERQILNFGHTFGHAVEKCSGFTIPHGSAVAIGMVIMMTACVKKGICQKDDLYKLKNVLEKYKLPTETQYTENELFDTVLSDKKRASDRITLVVTRNIGNCELLNVSLSEAQEFLKLGLE